MGGAYQYPHVGVRFKFQVFLATRAQTRTFHLATSRAKLGDFITLGALFLIIMLFAPTAVRFPLRIVYFY